MYVKRSLYLHISCYVIVKLYQWPKFLLDLLVGNISTAFFLPDLIPLSAKGFSAVFTMQKPPTNHCNALKAFCTG